MRAIQLMLGTQMHTYFLQCVVKFRAAMWMRHVFSHVEYCDMHFVYVFCDGNARAAVEEFQRLFPYQGIPSRSLLTRIHQSLRNTGSLPSVAVQSEREVVRKIDTRENILEMLQRSRRLSTRRIAYRIGVSRMQVWRTLHKEILPLP